MMQITKDANGNVKLQLSEIELYWFGQSLNECCNGFRIADFKGSIGVDRETAVQLLDQISSMYSAPVGHEA